MGAIKSHCCLRDYSTLFIYEIIPYWALRETGCIPKKLLSKSFLNLCKRLRSNQVKYLPWQWQNFTLGYGYGSAGSPHVSSGGSASHLGTAGTGLHGLPTTGNGSHMGSQPIYHLSSLPPPASIAEPGSNSLDEVLKAPGESEYKFFLL